MNWLVPATSVVLLAGGTVLIAWAGVEWRREVLAAAPAVRKPRVFKARLKGTFRFKGFDR